MLIDATTIAGGVLALGPLVIVILVLTILLRKRAELRQFARTHYELRDARERGSARARLQHPSVDLAHCIGCGACVRACPEEGVLSLMHGQAVVVHGARCVGHGLCADACPTNAIAITLGDLSDRDDLPAVDSEFAAINVPGLFLAGEIGGFALVRTAIKQGVAVADSVARRLDETKESTPSKQPHIASDPGDDSADPLDLLIVGAGPGGIACALRAKELGMHFLVIDQADELGGTVATYPRRKMVMTQPVELPLYGQMPCLTYQKEELVEIWETVAREHKLPIELGRQLTDLKQDDEQRLVAETPDGLIVARNVCLALGRRGTPRKLDVPGEDRSKVAYNLIDAESYQGRNVLVVGGGDSAIEAALGLSEQPGNTVTLSYRKKAFFRLKARNESRLQRALSDSRLRVIYQSDVEEIDDHEVRLRIDNDGTATTERIPNDDVFIFAGGKPPFDLLKKAGVSFNPEDRPQSAESITRGAGLIVALILTLTLSLILGVWMAQRWDYYGLQSSLRASLSRHELLRPAGPLGLITGVVACLLILWNLAYLIKRSSKYGRRLPGTLTMWMDSHICTGLAAFFCILLHGGFAIRSTVGGHAFLALGIVVITGSIGRYLYAFVPRAANGSEMDLEKMRQGLAQLSGEWDREGRGFGTRVRDEIDRITTVERWRPGLINRLRYLLVGQLRLRQTLKQLREEGHQEGIPQREIAEMLLLARRAYRIALIVMHYEEIRALLSSWRYFHRWLALLMVLLATVHIVTAVRYAQFDWFTWTRSLAGAP